MPSTKPKSLLLDATAIIHLHELGLWDEVCVRTTVIVPSIIGHEAYYYHDPVTDERIAIDLAELVAQELIEEAEATPLEMFAFATRFEPGMAARLHEGELEALTLLASGRLGACCFCSADRAAIQALVLAGLGACGISLEKALAQLGLSHRAPVNAQHSERAFRKWRWQARAKHRRKGHAQTQSGDSPL